MSIELPEKSGVGAQSGVRSAGSGGALFGLPLDKFGLFASLLISLSSGFIAFFVTTFVGIFVILFYNTSGHHRALDFAIAYKVVAFPLGILVAVVSLFFLGYLWIRRKLTENHGNPLDT